MSTTHKKHLFKRLGDTTSAVVYGQVLTAIIQGSLGGLMLLAFGIPNAIFWGLLMIIFAFIPFIGTPIIWLPIGILQLMNGHYVAGFGILIIGSLIIAQIDNLIRPYLIGNRAKISTPVVLIGVLGGLQVFGFIGLILGPVLLGLLFTVLEFLREKPENSKA